MIVEVKIKGTDEIRRVTSKTGYSMVEKGEATLYNRNAPKPDNVTEAPKPPKTRKIYRTRQLKSR